MISFSKNVFKRSSIDSSKESINSDPYIKQDELVENKTSRNLLFFVPLILCVLLLIIGIFLFIFFGKQIQNNFSNKQNQRIKFSNPYEIYPNYKYKRLECQSDEIENSKSESKFVEEQVNCGLNNSFVINYYYINKTYPINPNEIILINNIENLLNLKPIVEFNKEFLSKLNYISFIFIFIGDFDYFQGIYLIWIRYISLFNFDESDICSYHLSYFGLIKENKYLLLYGTNSNKFILKAKTICYQSNLFSTKNYFPLKDYIHFNKLELIASTKYYLRSN